MYDNAKAKEKRKKYYAKKYKQNKDENEEEKKQSYGRRGQLQLVSDSESDHSEEEDFLEKRERGEKRGEEWSGATSSHSLLSSPFLTRKLRMANTLTYSSKQDKATSKQKKLKQWRQVLLHWNDNDFELNHSIHLLVAELIPMGVPSSIRPKVWGALSSADDLMQKNRGVYLSMLELNEKTHRFDEYIEDDIPRTLPKHPLFNGPSSEGQRELRNILRAYAVFNPAVGYCQGMNFIAGALYLTFRNSEMVFWAFVNILQKVKGLFSEGVPLLNLSLDLLDKLLHSLLPLVSAHLARQKITLAPFAAQWFSTLFCFAEIPQKLSCRILDILLYSGYEIIFRVGLAILKLCSQALGRLKGEDIIVFARSPPESYLQPSVIINIALSFEFDEEISRQIYEATN